MRSSPGRYSTVDFAAEGVADSEPAWRLRGSVQIGDSTYQLEIEDDDGFARSLPLAGLVLAAGEHRGIVLEVDVAAVVDGVDWAALRGEEDHIEVDDDDPEMANFRARLVSSITVAAIE